MKSFVGPERRIYEYAIPLTEESIPYFLAKCYRYRSVRKFPFLISNESDNSRAFFFSESWGYDLVAVREENDVKYAKIVGFAGTLTGDEERFKEDLFTALMSMS